MHRRIDAPNLLLLDRDVLAADTTSDASCLRLGGVGSDLIDAVIINLNRSDGPAGNEKSVRHAGGSDLISLNKISMAVRNSVPIWLHLLLRRKVSLAMMGG